MWWCLLDGNHSRLCGVPSQIIANCFIDDLPWSHGDRGTCFLIIAYVMYLPQKCKPMTDYLQQEIQPAITFSDVIFTEPLASISWGYQWPESHLHQPHTRATQKLGMLGKSLTSCQPTPFQPSTKYKSRVWWNTLQSPWWVLHKLSRSTTPSRTIQLPYMATNAPHLSFTSPQAHWVCYLHHLQDCTVATCTLAVPPKTMTTTTRKDKGSRSMGTPLPAGSLQSRTSFWLVNYIAILHCCWVSSVGL